MSNPLTPEAANREKARQKLMKEGGEALVVGFHGGEIIKLPNGEKWVVRQVGKTVGVARCGRCGEVAQHIVMKMGSGGQGVRCKECFKIENNVTEAD